MTKNEPQNERTLFESGGWWCVCWGRSGAVVKRTRRWSTEEKWRVQSGELSTVMSSKTTPLALLKNTHCGRA